MSVKKKFLVPIKAKACVHVVIDTTKLGTEEQERLTRRPSAKRTSLFPPGQIIWSTCVLTFSQVKSCVLRDITSISVLEWPMLQTIHPFFILSMWDRVTTDLLPEAVITMSTLLITTSNLTTWNYKEKYLFFFHWWLWWLQLKKALTAF